MTDPKSRSLMTPLERGNSDAKQPHPMLILVLGFLTAVGFAGACLCGGMVWWFRPVFREDADYARNLTAQVVDIGLLDASKTQAYLPKGTIEWNVAFLLNVRGVYYERFAGDGLLTLIEVNSRFRTEEDVRRHIRQTLEEKGGGGAALKIDETLTKRVTTTVRGEQIEFTFRIGKAPSTGHSYHLVEGVFDGNNGEVLLAMRVDDDVWSEAEALDIIRSIK
jgi:hypothetical protein